MITPGNKFLKVSVDLGRLSSFLEFWKMLFHSPLEILTGIFHRVESMQGFLQQVYCRVESHSEGTCKQGQCATQAEKSLGAKLQMPAYFLFLLSKVHSFYDVSWRLVPLLFAYGQLSFCGLGNTLIDIFVSACSIYSFEVSSFSSHSQLG